jgi:DNA-binding response OmpR family regulator
VSHASPGERDQPLVLVADDDEDILHLVEFRLGRSGYRVVTASDGEEALRVALEQRPDLAVLDVMMPKLTGIEVTERLRASEDVHEMPIILLTARVQDGDAERGYEAGADEYVRKPFSPHELGDRVQALLDRV